MKIENVKDIKNKYTHNVLNYVYIIYSYINLLDVVPNNINNVYQQLTQIERITKTFNKKRLKIDEKLYDLIHQYINNTNIIINNIEQIDHNSDVINDCIFEIKFLLIQMKDNIKELISSIKNKNNDNIFNQQYFDNNDYSKLTSNCWINKHGDVYNCNQYQHSLLADAIKNKIYPNSNYCGEELLEQLGWVKISNNVVMFCGYEMSDDQKWLLYKNKLIKSFDQCV